MSVAKTAPATRAMISKASLTGLLALLTLAPALGSSGGSVEPAAQQHRSRGRQLYTIPEEHLENVADDPWMPCTQQTASGEVRGFCRLSCTAKWAYAPQRMDCEMLEPEELLKRSFGIGLAAYRTLSEDSFSKARTGIRIPANR